LRRSRRGPSSSAEQARVARSGDVELADPQYVARRLGRRGAQAIGLGEIVEIGDGEAGRALRADALAERFLDRRLPAAHHLVQSPVERRGVGRRRPGVD
jgi:hypothetical protein